MPHNALQCSNWRTAQCSLMLFLLLFESCLHHPDEELHKVRNIDVLTNDFYLIAPLLLKTQIGITTDDIDRLVHKTTVENGAYPSAYNYWHFPKSICTSVNNVACHGIPDDRALEDGDIVNVDIAVYLGGYHGDCSKTFLVGNVDHYGKALVDVTEQCLNSAVDLCKPGRRFQDVGNYISKTCSEMGYTVIPSFIGHGVGSYFHGPPDIYHSVNTYPGVMKPGMTFTIEPVIGQGTEIVDILEDGWTAVTIDGSRTAQFEHTILITNDGVRILTIPD